MIAIAKGKLRNSGMKHFSTMVKAINLKKMIQLYSSCKDLEMKRIDLQLPLIEQKELKDYQNLCLDQIDGIGAIRKRALLNHFGSARSVESASFDEIKSVEGVEEKVAKKIYNFFHE